MSGAIDIRPAGDDTAIVIPNDDGLWEGHPSTVYIPNHRIGELTVALFRYARRRRLVPTLWALMRDSMRRR